MVFSSQIFLYYFLPFALLVYFGMMRLPQAARNAALAVLGYIFYAWFNPKYVVFMWFTTVFDWFLSLVIANDGWNLLPFLRQSEVKPLPRGTMRSRTQKTAIVLSLVSNLGMLGFFKYFNFSLQSYNFLASTIGWNRFVWGHALNVLLPLGISFYVFQSLSYTIDVYRGDARAMRRFTDFACFVSMFPHLVAGPILKFEFLAEQLHRRSHTVEKTARGASFFMLGMAKKVLIANACGQLADYVFNAASRSCLDAWLGAIAYTFQILFDFSGYSDMAIGLGLIFGFIFARNFDYPYSSESITEFWRRWHISLSTWLREYLYIPLGGNRKGRLRTYANLILTMLLGGLWHGAGWTFLVWGGIHGGLLAIERLLGKRNPLLRAPRLLRIAITFFVVMISWVFFRSRDVTTAFRYLACMGGFVAPNPRNAIVESITCTPYFFGVLALAAALTWGFRDTWEFTQRLTIPKVLLSVVLFLVSLLLLAGQSYNPFIYFQF